MTEVVFSVKAEADLAALLDYLNSRSPQAAGLVLDRIVERLDLLSFARRMGRARPEIRPGVRSTAVSGYLLLYRVGEREVRVLRIVSAHSDLGDVDTED